MCERFAGLCWDGLDLSDRTYQVHIHVNIH